MSQKPSQKVTASLEVVTQCKTEQSGLRCISDNTIDLREEPFAK